MSLNVKYLESYFKHVTVLTSRVRFPKVSLEFFIDIILLAHYGPGVDSASNSNEYQEYFMGGKVGRCVGLTNISPFCADCLEI